MQNALVTFDASEEVHVNTQYYSKTLVSIGKFLGFDPWALSIFGMSPVRGHSISWGLQMGHSILANCRPLNWSFSFGWLNGFAHARSRPNFSQDYLQSLLILPCVPFSATHRSPRPVLGLPMRNSDQLERPLTLLKSAKSAVFSIHRLISVAKTANPVRFASHLSLH
jgi:hypothetical protein